MRPVPRILARAFACAALVLACASPASAAEPTGLRADWLRGANVTAWWHDAYAQPDAAESIDELAATGTTHAAIVSTWYVDTGSDSTIARDPLKTPDDASLLVLMARARHAGLRLTLKPHVDSHDGTFRGHLAPADPAAWWSSYRAMMLHNAELAEQAGVELLEVGTELSSMTAYEADWRALIAEVRTRFSGKLTFAANWVDGARAVRFWDALDYIGVDAYMPLVDDEPNPSVERIERAWRERGHVAALRELHEHWGKPLLITEIGYQSREWTAATPWCCAAGGHSQEAQARAVEAAYRVWSAEPWVAGLYWWDWPAVSYNAGADTSWPVRGKLAEGTIAAWNRTLRPPDPPAPPAVEPPPAPPAPSAARQAPRRLRLGLRVPRAPRSRVSVSLRVPAGRTAAAERAAGCVVSLKLTRRVGGGRRRVLLRDRVHVPASGSRRLRLPRLAPGSYRVSAAADGSRCVRRSARSFRLR